MTPPLANDSPKDVPPYPFAARRVSALGMDHTPRHEREIVWLRPIDDLEYVREMVVDTNKRSGEPSPGSYSGTLVGYANLAPSAQSSDRYFRRRIWWLADHDRAFVPNGVYAYGAPSEAVDPATVFPNRPSLLTFRAWGRHAG